MMETNVGDGPENAECLIQIRGISDGWSVAQMKDGRMLNRWPPEDRRHKPTQDWIELTTSADELADRLECQNSTNPACWTRPQ